MFFLNIKIKNTFRTFDWQKVKFPSYLRSLKLKIFLDFAFYQGVFKAFNQIVKYLDRQHSRNFIN